MEGGGEQESMMSSDHIQEIGGSSSSNGGKSSLMCRQSSTRWTPTTEQIRILKELYYNNGVRSPTAEQIQRISAKLRQYGKIEGKNVFYWFQNHKARERQKKRFTADHQIPTTTMHRKIINDPLPPPHPIKFSSPYNIYNNISPPNASSPPHFITTHQHVGHNYGSIAMAEKSFRECSINPSGNVVGGHNIAWIGVDPYHHHNHNQQHNPFLENKRHTTICKRDFQTLEMAAAEQEEEELDQIETLPLFPMHGDLINNDYFTGWHRRGGGTDDDDSSAAAAAGPMSSLELTLNSYADRFSTC